MQLNSAEAYGAVTVVCTSRTGPLTGHAMKVTTIRTLFNSYGITGEGYVPEGAFVSRGHNVSALGEPDLWHTLDIAALMSHADVMLSPDGWRPVGEAMDAALLVAARKAGIDRDSLLIDTPRLAELAYSTARGFSASFHRVSEHGALTVCIKGMPEEVLAACGFAHAHGGVVPLDASARASILAANHALGRCGLRVLALAHGAAVSTHESAVRELTFAGLLGIADPPAPGVTEAIETFHQAGIRTVMLTRDQEDTAVAVAGDLGLAGGSELTLGGGAIEAMPEYEIPAHLANVNVFSRVTSQAARQIVSGLRTRGEVVATVGASVNGAVTLRLRDEGAVPLPAETLDALVARIRAGRTYIDNVRKLALYIASCGIVGTLLFLWGGVFGGQMTWRQGLWLALVTSLVPAFTLRVEPAQDDVMRRPPRTLRAALISPALARAVLLYAGVLAAAVSVALIWTRASGLPAPRAATITFLVLAFAQVLHLGNARDTAPVVRPRRAFANVPALTAVTAVVLLQVLSVSVEPLRSWLGLTPLGRGDWMVVLGAGALPAVAGQAVKLMGRA